MSAALTYPVEPVAEAVAIARRRSDVAPHRDHLIALLAVLDEARNTIAKVLDERHAPERSRLLHTEHAVLTKVLER